MLSPKFLGWLPAGLSLYTCSCENTISTVVKHNQSSRSSETSLRLPMWAESNPSSYLSCQGHGASLPLALFLSSLLFSFAAHEKPTNPWSSCAQDFTLVVSSAFSPRLPQSPTVHSVTSSSHFSTVSFPDHHSNYTPQFLFHWSHSSALFLSI